MTSKNPFEINWPLNGGPVKKLGCSCEIKRQSNKIPAVTIFHTQHWTYQLYEQLFLAIVYKHPMALVHNGAKKFWIHIWIFIIQPLTKILFELLCHYLENFRKHFLSNRGWWNRIHCCYPRQIFALNFFAILIFTDISFKIHRIVCIKQP